MSANMNMESQNATPMNVTESPNTPMPVERPTKVQRKLNPLEAAVAKQKAVAAKAEAAKAAKAAAAAAEKEEVASTADEECQEGQLGKQLAELKEANAKLQKQVEELTAERDAARQEGQKAERELCYSRGRLRQLEASEASRKEELATSRGAVDALKASVGMTIFTRIAGAEVSSHMTCEDKPLIVGKAAAKDKSTAQLTGDVEGVKDKHVKVFYDTEEECWMLKHASPQGETRVVNGKGEERTATFMSGPMALSSKDVEIVLSEKLGLQVRRVGKALFLSEFARSA